MKKTLLDFNAVNELVVRVENLTAGTPGRWGKMNATEMLLHCTLADQFILEDKSPFQMQTFKQRVITKLCLYILPLFPKNSKGPLRFNATGKINDPQFEEQKKQFINTLLRFPVHNKAFTSIHPGMGFLTTEEWGAVAWMHMDHHLRQFGV